MEDGDVTEKHMDRLAPLKRCPKCGKSFHVRHTEETVRKTGDVVPEEKVVLPVAEGAVPVYPMPTIKVEQAIEEDHYTETYTCSNCGYQWTEEHDKVKDLGQLNSADGI